MAEGVGEGEMPEVGGDEGFQACFCPFVETFEQIQGEGVLDAVVAGDVVDGIALKDIGFVLIVTAVLIVVARPLVCLVDAVGIVVVEGMDEARHGHVLVLHP